MIGSSDQSQQEVEMGDVRQGGWVRQEMRAKHNLCTSSELVYQPELQVLVREHGKSSQVGPM